MNCYDNNQMKAQDQFAHEKQYDYETLQQHSNTDNNDIQDHDEELFEDITDDNTTYESKSTIEMSSEIQHKSSVNEHIYYSRKPKSFEIKQIHYHQEELEDKRRKQVIYTKMENEKQCMVKEDELQQVILWNEIRECHEMQIEEELASILRATSHEVYVRHLRHLLLERTCMFTEDEWSSRREKYDLEWYLKETEKRKFFQDLYKPIENHSIGNLNESNDFMLQGLQRNALKKLRLRIQDVENRKTKKYVPTYPISSAVALEIDDISLNTEKYNTRDSRKYKQLLGLSVRPKKKMAPKSTLLVPNRSRDYLKLADINDEKHCPFIADKKINNGHIYKKDMVEQLYSFPSLPDCGNTRKQEDITIANFAIDSLEQETNVHKYIQAKKTYAHKHNDDYGSIRLPYFKGSFGIRGEKKTPLSQKKYKKS